jgi:predicted nucleotidyltransferase
VSTLGSSVYLFGSAAQSDRDLVRDVDLAVLTDPALSLDELMRLRADLVTAVGPGIDLVSLNDASVVLAREVADTGQCLYTKSRVGEQLRTAPTRFSEFARAIRAWLERPP